LGSIYLIRHGQASFGAHDYDVLCTNGVRQAEVLGEHLARLGVGLDRCYSGELRRQRDTAQTVLQRMHSAGQSTPDIRIDAAFNEFKADEIIRAYLPELLDYEPDTMSILRNVAEHRHEFQRLFAFVIEHWLNGTAENSEVESWSAFTQRVQQGLHRVLAEAESGKQNIAIFTSGGTITALLHLITDVPPSKAFELNWQIVNTSLTRLHVRGSEVSLASFNSHAHLELLKAPELITYR
jgi:broad specificity phosphatase PhoE